MANGHIYILYNSDVLSSTTHRERAEKQQHKNGEVGNKWGSFFFATVFVQCFFSFLFFWVGVVVDGVYGRLGDDLFFFSFST